MPGQGRRGGVLVCRRAHTAVLARPMSVAGKTIILGGTVAIAIIAKAAFPMDGLTPVARQEIPAEMVDVYKSAATRCGRLPWQVVAAIGWVESRHAGGKAAADAIADELCGGAPIVTDLNLAIRRHTADPIDVMQILLKAARYGSGDVPDVDALLAAVSVSAEQAPAGSGGSAGVAVVRAALQMLGTPYVWGAESPADGFDCSGLVWWAYRQAGVSVARTTGDLVKAGVPIHKGELRPGDLLFTRGGQQVHDLGHVAIYAGGGMEVVAPRSGKSVTVQKVNIDRIQAVRRILA